MRAFWSVKEAGGDQSVPSSDNGLWWPQFSFKLHKQYLIWKLTFSAKVWYPIEVVEVQIAASGGCWSGQGPGEKKFDKKFWNLQFLSHTNIIHLKRKLGQSSFRFEIELDDFLWKKWKKLRVALCWSRQFSIASVYDFGLQQNQFQSVVHYKHCTLLAHFRSSRLLVKSAQWITMTLANLKEPKFIHRGD